MSPQRIIGIGLLVVGIILLLMGLNATDSLADRWSNFFTGEYTDRTMWYLFSGIVLAVVGGVMAAMGHHHHRVT